MSKTQCALMIAATPAVLVSMLSTLNRLPIWTTVVLGLAFLALAVSLLYPACRRSGGTRDCLSWVGFAGLTAAIVTVGCGALWLPDFTYRSYVWKLLAVFSGSYLIWALASWYLHVVSNRELPSKNSELASRYAAERAHHNEAIYRDFALFVKVTVALTGGLVYLALRFFRGEAALQAETLRILLVGGGGLQCLVGFLSAFSIFSHQRSKAKHWKALERNEHRKNRWRIYPGFLCWQETAVVVSMLAISFSIALLLPMLLSGAQP